MRQLTIRTVLFIFMLTLTNSNAQSLSDSIFVTISGGTFTMGEPESTYFGPPGTYDGYEHQVTLSSYKIMTTEVTNQQYVDFLNLAYEDGLLEVKEETAMGPDQGSILVYGTSSAPSEYSGVAIVNLSGTRVMKDHVETSESQDGNPFTGIIEPENPLNISYIGFDETAASGQKFYVKDPRNSSDFDWQTLTDYYNYGETQGSYDTSVLLNDYDSWPELEDYPNNLPTQEEVTTWPASFIRWYGAKAFAMYYGADLPSEAQWEYAARGGDDFFYATSDGNVNSDGSSANWNWASEHPALHHVYNVRINQPNPYGLYNMAGNVWEWVEDWYSADFVQNDATDPVCNDATSGKKVRRGGSWNYHIQTLKVAARASDEQFKGNDHFGFRVVNNNVATSVGDAKSNIPNGFELFDNYPNPFNPTTTIKFSIPALETRHVSSLQTVLSVYDLLGNQVAELVNESKPAGTYTVKFDASNLSSGTYFYQLRAGNVTLTKKLILMK